MWEIFAAGAHTRLDPAVLLKCHERGSDRQYGPVSFVPPLMHRSILPFPAVPFLWPNSTRLNRLWLVMLSWRFAVTRFSRFAVSVRLVHDQGLRGQGVIGGKDAGSRGFCFTQSRKS